MLSTSTCFQCPASTHILTTINCRFDTLNRPPYGIRTKKAIIMNSFSKESVNSLQTWKCWLPLGCLGQTTRCRLQSCLSVGPWRSLAFLDLPNKIVITYLKDVHRKERNSNDYDGMRPRVMNWALILVPRHFLNDFSNIIYLRSSGRHSVFQI